MDNRIQLALEILERDYEKLPRISRIAEELNLSQSRFEHLFKQEMGQPFRQYIRQVRLEKAKDLLKCKNLSIKQVASEVGYNHPHNLARAFKKQFSITPSQFRREIQAQVLSTDC